MTLNKKDYLKVILCLIALISTFTTEIYAQELPIEHYTALDDIDPLPESPVLTAYQDSLGYLWVANYGFGLLRYDSQTMEKYPGVGKPLGLNVFALEEGPHGRLWVLSNDKGLVVSEKSLSSYRTGASVQFTDSLGAVPLYKGRIDLFGSPLTKDLQGAVWLGTSQEGIIRYQSNGPEAIIADTLATVMRSDSTYATVRAMITRRDGAVWVSLVNDSLLVFKGKERTMEKQGAPCIDIMELFEDSGESLWAGCSEGNIWRLDDETRTWTEEKPVGAVQAYITGIAEVAPGIVWATTLGKGVFELDVATGETMEYTRQNGFLDRNVWDVTTDREGNTWVSQNTGLSKLRMNQAAFRAYTSRSYTGERPALVGAEALATEPDIAWPLASGDTLQVLAAATSGGLSLIGSDGTLEHLTVEDGLTSDLLLDVCKDAVGRLWISTRAGIDILTTDKPAPDLPNFGQEQRLTLFGEEAILTSYRIGMASECGTPPRDKKLTEDSSEDEAIVCFVKAQRPAVACWAGNRWLFFDVGSGIPNESFATLAWDADGHLYAGASYSGLYRSTVPLSYAIPDTLVGSSETIAPFVTQPVFEQVFSAEGEPFANTGITKMLSVEQSLWVQPLDANTQIIEGLIPRITGEVDLSGLREFPNTMVYSPLTNTVWLSSDEGIMEVDTSAIFTGRRANQFDGLLYHTASGPPALSIGSGGMIYHSSTAGITQYQPSRDRQNNIPPRLDFRGIKYSEDNAGSNELEITYAALSYTSERQVRYRTRLLGYDDEWSEPTTETRARYTNLSAFALPRTYTFEVQASNNDGVWTEIPLAHQVRVEPAWWIKWWALTLYSGVFLALVFVSDRLQRKRLIEQEREKVRERELEQARETERAYAQLAESHQELKRTQEQLIQQEKLASLGQLTAGIAHEIKNPLNFVNNFSEVSLEMVEEVREEVRRMTEDEGPGGEKGEPPLSRGGGDPSLDGSARGVSGMASDEAFDPKLILDILDDIEANLKTINKHGTRADSIVKSMLQHSRGGDGKMEPTPLNPLIKEYVNLAFHGMRAANDPINVDIDLQLDEKVGDVPLVAEDFSRVVLNIVNNGFDAMREKTLQGFETLGGLDDYQPKLTIRTHREENTVTIDIEDNGPGIPDEMKDKILQPFFTTKKGTQGTGLGLSITNDIIKAHGGEIDIKSVEGERTRFIINIPKV